MGSATLPLRAKNNMVKIQNTDAINIIRSGARLSISEGFPQELNMITIPTLDMTPDFHRVSNSASLSATTSAGAATVLAADANNDVYLNSATLAVTKSATCDVATGTHTLSVTVDGATKVIFAIPLLTLTASDQIATIVFNPPVKIDRNTAISTSNLSFAAGSLSRFTGITYTKVTP